MGLVQSRQRALLIIVLVQSLLAVTALGEEKDMMRHLTERNEDVRQELAQFEAKKDPEFLRKAYRSISAVPIDQSQQNWKEACHGIIRTTLRIAEKCYSARDYSYDLENHPPLYTKVSPPLGSAPFIVAGMDPKLIKDPDARKQYEEAIAENDRRCAKDSRERSLQQTLDRCIWRLQVLVKCLPPNEEPGNSGIEIIKSAVKQEALRDLILRQIAEKKEEEKQE